MLALRADPCDCADDECEELRDPQEGCVNFIARNHEVKMRFCDRCESYTWHRDRNCLQIKFHRRDYKRIFLNRYAVEFYLTLAMVVGFLIYGKCQ